MALSDFQYDAVGNVVGGLQPYTPTGVVVATIGSPSGTGPGATDSANNPTPPQQLQGGVYNGILTVGGGLMQSGNFVSGSSGWAIMSDGSAEFNNGTFRGTLSASTILVAGVSVNQVVTLVRDFTQSSSTNSSTPVKTYSVAAGVMGTNSTLRVTVFVSANTTNGGARVNFGGGDLSSGTFSAGASYDLIGITNRGFANSQFYSQTFISDSVSPKVNSGTLSIDTTSAQTIKLYDSGASGTFTVEGWIVELLK